MQTCIYPKSKPDKSAPVRVSFRRAAKRLGQGGGLLTLALCAVFCLLACITLYLFFEILCLVLGSYTTLSFGLLMAIAASVSALVLFMLLLPLFVGRVRVAGLLALGEEPLQRELFYYFTSAGRYARGLLISLCYLCSFLLPLVCGAGAFVGSFFLYDRVFYVNLPDGIAVLLAVACYLASAGFCVLCLYLSAFHFSLVVSLIGNSRCTLKEALARAFLLGKHYRGSIFRFLLQVIWRLLLSLCTLGVLWVMYYAHLVTLGYWEMVITMERELEASPESKGETEYESIC